MFMTVDFEGGNCASHIPDGPYRGLCTFSKAPGEDFNVAFVEYTLEGRDQPTVVDLLLIDPRGDRFFRDFIRMPDRSWRDSYGARNDELNALLPPEILQFEVLEQREVGQFLVEGGYVR
jgi:hypothetical protein